MVKMNSEKHWRSIGEEKAKKKKKRKQRETKGDERAEKGK